MKIKAGGKISKGILDGADISRGFVLDSSPVLIAELNAAECAEANGKEK